MIVFCSWCLCAAPAADHSAPGVPFVKNPRRPEKNSMRRNPCAIRKPAGSRSVPHPRAMVHPALMLSSAFHASHFILRLTAFCLLAPVPFFRSSGPSGRSRRPQERRSVPRSSGGAAEFSPWRRPWDSGTPRKIPTLAPGERVPKGRRRPGRAARHAVCDVCGQRRGAPCMSSWARAPSIC